MEKELIKQIKQLKQIKPNQEWVALTKNQILGEEPIQRVNSRFTYLSSLFSWKPVWKPAFVGLLVLFVLAGVFAFSQSSLPGDLLYPVKRAAEKSQAIFVSQADMANYNLKMANKRLQEITEIVQKQENESKKKGDRKQNNIQEKKEVEPVIKEFQQSVVVAAQGLAQIGATTSSDPVMIKKIVKETKKLEENKKKVERLGVKVGETEELDQTLSLIVAREIEQMENNVLTEEDKQALTEIKQAYEAGNYSGALEKILLLNYPPR